MKRRADFPRSKVNGYSMKARSLWFAIFPLLLPLVASAQQSGKVKRVVGVLMGATNDAQGRVHTKLFEDSLRGLGLNRLFSDLSLRAM